MGALTWIAFALLAFFTVVNLITNIAKPKQTAGSAVAVAIGFIINVALVIVIGFAAATLVSLGA
jgi:hypothetical protein